jgi:CBS-domain-containing membrane protein
MRRACGRAEKRNLYGALTVAALSATLVLAPPSTALALSARGTSLIRARQTNG